MPPEPAKNLPSPRTVTPFLPIATAVLATTSLLLFAANSQAQTFTVLHTFSGENDGGYPGAGLLLDAAGNLYGETAWGGHFGADCSVGCGTVFKLTRHGSNWFLNTLYAFQSGSDGAIPLGFFRASDGTIYGVTSVGGTGTCDNDRGCEITP